MREAKARVDLPANRAMLDEFGYSVDLLLHALQSQLKETGEFTFQLYALKAGSYFAAGRTELNILYFNFLCISTNGAMEFPAISLACCVSMNAYALILHSFILISCLRTRRRHTLVLTYFLAAL